MRTPEFGLPLAVPASPELFDLLPVGLAEIAVDGGLLRVNRALRRLLRHPGGPTTGMDLLDLGWSVPGYDRASVLAALFEEEAASGMGRVLRFLHHDGTELFVRAFARRVRTNDPAVAFLAVVTDVTAEVRAERALAETERRLRLAFDASPDGWAVFTVEPGHHGQPTIIRHALLNTRARALTGQDEDQLPGREVGEVLGWASGEWIRSQVAAALAHGQAPPTRTPVEVSGEWRLIESTVVRLDVETVLCSWQDVTEFVDAERRLNRAYEETAEMRATLQTALDATSDGFAIYQLEWEDETVLTGMRVVHANAAGAESLGLDPETIVGMELHTIFPTVESSGLWERIVAAAVTKEPQHHRVQLYDEEGRWTSAWDNTVAPVGEERMAITWRDVTSEEKALRQLARTRDEAMHSATHDALTDLPNRVLLRQHLTQALRNCAADERVALIFVDLDRFKAINDTYGHAAGDVVLKATATRLERMVRHGDLAARLAGDEFVLVLTGLTSDWTPDQFFARGSAMLSEPVSADGVELHPSASLGAVLADPHGERVDVDDLVKRADAEMYRAKAARR